MTDNDENTPWEIAKVEMPWARVPRGLVEDALSGDLTSGALLTYAFLMLRYDCARDKSIQVWEKMAKERGVSIRAWREHLHQLEDAGWLLREMHDIEGVGVRASIKLFVVRGGRKSKPVSERIGGRV